ncbi:MAG: sensor histidine kinase [Eubacteriaceae bacterium]
MIEIISSYIFCLLDIIVMTLTLHRINKGKIRSGYLLIVTPFVLSIVLLLSDYFIRFNILNVIADGVAVFLLVFIIMEGKFFQLIYQASGIFISLSILDMITAIIVINIFDVTIQESVNILLIKTIAWIISRGVYLYLFPKINIYYLNLNILKGKSKYSLMVFFLFDLIFILFCYSLFLSYSTIEISYFIVLVLLSIIIFNILLNNLLKKIDEYIYQDMEWKQREDIYKMRLKNIEQEFQHIDQFQKEKHDFNQHLQMILAYISTEKIKDAKDYIFKLTDKIENLDQIKSSKHPEINSFILYKTNIANNNGIKIEKNIKLPDRLFIETIDLTIILGNLFDNAIESNEFNKIEKRKIIVNMHEKNNYLIIHTENPYTRINLKNNILETTKIDKENHGIGLKNINFIVEKYNGFMEMDTSGGIFSIKIALENLKEAVYYSLGDTI